MNVPGVGNVNIAQHNCKWNDEVCIWSYYKLEPHSYKIYGTRLRGYYVGQPIFSMSNGD